MTQLLLSDVHTAIDTLEALLSYAAEAFYYQYPGSIQLTNNQGQRVNYPYSQVNQFEADDGRQYRQYTTIVPIKKDASTTPRYQWMQTEEVDKSAPLQFPEAYKNSSLTA